MIRQPSYVWLFRLGSFYGEWRKRGRGEGLSLSLDAHKCSAPSSPPRKSHAWLLGPSWWFLVYTSSLKGIPEREIEETVMQTIHPPIQHNGHHAIHTQLSLSLNGSSSLSGFLGGSTWRTHESGWRWRQWRLSDSATSINPDLEGRNPDEWLEQKKLSCVWYDIQSTRRSPF